MEQKEKSGKRQGEERGPQEGLPLACRRMGIPLVMPINEASALSCRGTRHLLCHAEARGICLVMPRHEASISEASPCHADKRGVRLFIPRQNKCSSCPLQGASLVMPRHEASASACNGTYAEERGIRFSLLHKTKRE